MGIMPFHLEKGVMGLRFDYLTRTQEVRDDLRSRLEAGADAFDVASGISITWPGHPNIVIDALHDNFNAFKQALDDLVALNPAPLTTHERRTGGEYQQDNNGLDQRNRDTPGNRAAFVGYWNVHAPLGSAPRNQMGQAILKALNPAPGEQNARLRIDYWWDCTLPDGDPPGVITSFDVPHVARVFFCTPHLDQAGGAPWPVESSVRGSLQSR